MSMPNFPANTPLVTRDEAVNQILVSIALEELSLSHILNAGGESIQHVLGTLPGQAVSTASPGEIAAVNESVRELLEASTESQRLLKDKMETALCGCLCEDCGGDGSCPVISSAFAANTSGTILVVILGGTTVPLPNSQLFSTDITANVENTVFTVQTAGRYRLAYQVNTTAALAAGTRLLINGVENTASTVAPLISLSHYDNEVIVDLAAGSTVSLQMFGVVSTATLVPGALGASLSIIRLS